MVSNVKMNIDVILATQIYFVLWFSVCCQCDDAGLSSEELHIPVAHIINVVWYCPIRSAPQVMSIYFHV